MNFGDYLPNYEEVRNIIENISDEKYRLAFKYQYLIAGRVSEVCGKYAPLGCHAYHVEINDEEAVLFGVLTARSKRPLYRAVAVPLKYEPWAKDLLKWFRKNPNQNPFIFVKKENPKPRTNDTYMIREAKKIFKNLTWRIPEYFRSIKNFSNDEKNLMMVLELASRGEVQVEYRPPKTISKVEPEHSAAFTSLALRYVRAFELLTVYNFTPIDLSIYGGWKPSTLSLMTPSMLDRYRLFESPKPDKKILKSMASIYFKKLLKN